MRKILKIKGNITSIITPMNKERKIDYKSIGRIIKHQIKNKIKNIVIAGTTGEGYSLSLKEHIKIIKYCKKTSRRKINIISGNCSNSTIESIYINKKIDKLKIKAILQVVPYYNSARQKGIYKHFVNIAENTKTPIIIYNVPKRTNTNIETKTIKKILRETEGRIIGIKNSIQDINEYYKLIKENKKKFKIYCGDDINFHIKYMIGSYGHISVASNLIPKEINSIYKNIVKKKYTKSITEYNKIEKLIKKMFIETNPVPIKYMLKKIGIIKTSKTRLPLLRIKKRNKEIINKEINKLKEINNKI